jgi:hypothetical protein
MSGIKSNKLEPSQAQQILTEVQNKIQLSLQSPVHLLPGQSLLATILPATPEIDASELVNGILNIAWLEKDVLFKDVKAVTIPVAETTSNATDLNGDKIISQLETDPTSVVKQLYPPPFLGGSPLSQTPGLAAQLAGSITLPKLSVNIQTHWIIRNSAGAELADGKDIVALNGLTGTSVSILLPPVFRELRMDKIANPGGTVFCLSVEVTLSIGDISLPFTLGPIPVLQLPLLIPTVVALFSEPNFTVTDNSSVVIWVPKHSVFSSAAPLFKELRKVEAVLDSLRSIAGIAGFLLGLSEITDLTEHPRLRFVAANEIPNLGEILLKRKPWYDILGDDETFNDKTSSLFVFGLPGTTVNFYNNSKFNKDSGYYQIRLKTSVDLQATPDPLSPLPDFFVAIRSFYTKTEVEVHPELKDAWPETFPLNRINDEYDDPNSDNVWDNRLSSVKFDLSWFKDVDNEIRSPEIITELLCARPAKKSK